MDQIKIGLLIRSLRLERGLTQLELARRLGVTDRAVSKWERCQGCPDVSLLPGLSGVLGIPVDSLLAGDLDEQDNNGGSMKQTKFFLCPQCGNLITASGSAALACCGRTLTPLEPQRPDPDHQLTIEQVENEWYLTSPHPMDKAHHLSFAALVTSERVTLIRRWPEWDFQVRLPRGEHGLLYWHCTRHGLFRQVL